MAARGACTVRGRAGGRYPSQREPNRGLAHAQRCISSGSHPSRLQPGPESDDRGALGGGPVRSPAGYGSRSHQARCRFDRCVDDAIGTSREIRNRKNPHCVHYHRRSGADRIRFKLERPGGNLTGVTYLGVEVGPKLLELLHEAVPSAKIMALLINPTNPNADSQFKNLQAAAGRLGLQLYIVNASTEGDLDPAFAKAHELQTRALMVAFDAFFNARPAQLATLSLRYAIPAIYPARDFSEAGGLMSYGADPHDMYRQAGIYAGRILKGEKPADLPVVQASKFEMVINLKAAKTIGLTLSPDVISIADEV